MPYFSFAHTYARALRILWSEKCRKLYTGPYKFLTLTQFRVYSWPAKLYTNCSPTLHRLTLRQEKHPKRRKYTHFLADTGKKT